MKLEYYRTGFYILLALLALYGIRDYSHHKATEALVHRLAGQSERFNNESWRKVVPAVKDVILELRVYLGIALAGDEAARLKAEADKQTAAKRAEEKELRDEQRQYEAAVHAAIQAAVVKTPKEYILEKADPTSISAEFAAIIERKIHQLFPNCTAEECAQMSHEARCFLSARGQGLADDVIAEIREDCGRSDDEGDYEPPERP